MQLSKNEITVLTAAIQDELDAEGKTEVELPPWDISRGWPANDRVYRVEPIPESLARVVGASLMGAPVLCGMLRQQYDTDLKSDWVFVPINFTVVLAKGNVLRDR